MSFKMSYQILNNNLKAWEKACQVQSFWEQSNVLDRVLQVRKLRNLIVERCNGDLGLKNNKTVNHVLETLI